MTEAPRVYRSLEEAGRVATPSVVTIGNFDGVHIGHQRILRRVAEIGRQRGWRPLAVTFDPHPLAVLAPERSPLLLSSPEQRAGWMAECGVPEVLILPFTYEFSQTPPESFVAEILVQGLHAKAVLVGENFRFGRDQRGDCRLLRDLGHHYGFEVEVVPPVRYRRWIVSSTAVRELLQRGRVSLACRMLGRPYSLVGRLQRGSGIGSQLTAPTLNLEPSGELLPARGVYVTWTRDLALPRHWPSVTNVGVRPTFGGQQLRVETHILEGFDGRPPEHFEVAFLLRLRDEIRFPSPEALREQIQRDVARSQKFFRRLQAWTKYGLWPARPQATQEDSQSSPRA